ncbi:hypothetical protein M9H77_13574 [Catharanthus roseus]|uniref:Uncharacterized protein n=1 Tax=Catharanthus roseus TaxID=4058 RepID=A0ACC0BKM1_CATRO|nr:hypothetical protein M9H77_13574 [Catharanthus roseus]
MRCLAKGVLSPVLPEDPGMILISLPEVAVTKERKKTNSTRKDKSYWEHVSIAHRKIQKSSGFGSGSGSGFGSGLRLGSGSAWFYDYIAFVFVFGSSRRYIGYWSLDRTTTLYSKILPIFVASSRLSRSSSRDIISTRTCGVMRIAVAGF